MYRTKEPDQLHIREKLEEREQRTLCPQAQLSAKTQGRRIPEPECSMRPAFQHDRDRILHCKAFRRLKHKTQVFLAPTGDHYRTRLTHTLEVAQIGRTICRALELNEDLAEAIALGHDLGHTPFGHSGEAVLDEIFPGGFSHQEQSLRVVDLLERDGRGLNLTMEVRDGILKHSKGRGVIITASEEDRPATLEGQVVRVADIIAYISHDIEDAIRGGVVATEDVPEECRLILGDTHSARLNSMVRDLICQTMEKDMRLGLSEEIHGAMLKLRDFLYENVYENPKVRADFIRARRVVADLYEYLLDSEEATRSAETGSTPERYVCDYIAGMTDRYALNLYQKVFLPRPWLST
ncbi:MAG: deoxyguanosinetriphosphate triphosphohydrolase [Pseudomonadota bacterium]